MSQESAAEKASCLTEAGDEAGAICATATSCRRVRAPGGDEESPVCLGRSAPHEGSHYYWLCRQCVIVYPGFETEAAALRMAQAHCVLRWHEHAVGRAVRAKRGAGLEGNLTTDELRAAFGDR
ncbi:hypothetical protein [Streptomyces sp. WAC06614]|uniref:hypothetical protein n=1 Tax=Streptomyces sp. WAC06614 TaxID=2487416 RepID=UPI000F7A137F|nr:hypothetical protein [Streptomyces sp. WAC06614]RSS81170.1 hypothetical protein EF918_11285 [Streptomyces sp. WAC06614]